MLKRTRNLALFTVASIVLMAGGVYEGSTHVGRGWLRGVSGRRLEACTTMKPGEWAQAGSLHHNEAG